MTKYKRYLYTKTTALNYRMLQKWQQSKNLSYYEHNILDHMMLTAFHYMQCYGKFLKHRMVKWQQYVQNLSYCKDIKTLWLFQCSAVRKLQDCGVGNRMECNALECTNMDHSSMNYNIYYINPLNAELNPIFPLLALFGVHHILHVSR
jgi:hypothetical protein